MFPYEDSKSVSVCLSVCPSICPYPEKRNHHSFVNVSLTLVIDTSMERSSRVLHHGNSKMWFFFFKKFEIDEIDFCLYPEFPYAEKINRPVFVDISPTLVIYTSSERSSRVLHRGNQFFFQKSLKLNLTCAEELKSTFKYVSPICRHRGCIVVPLRVDI